MKIVKKNKKYKILKIYKDNYEKNNLKKINSFIIIEIIKLSFIYFH